MSGKSSEGMRIGPVSLLTLIAVLLLAVLAMLCVTTANAASAMANRQAEAIEQTYRVDACGQAILASIDDVAERANGDAENTTLTISKMSDEILNRAMEKCDFTGMTAQIDAEGNAVTIGVAQDGGKALDARILIDDDSGYTIQSWKITTTQELPQETLWTGSQTS